MPDGPDVRAAIARLRRPVADALAGEPLMDAAFATMLREVDRPALGGRALLGGLMKAALALLLRRWADRDGADALADACADPRLARAAAAIAAQPGAAHSVASLAAHAGMSRSAFARDFAATYAAAPMEYVARARLLHAAELLRVTDRPVKIVAGDSGYASRSHFSRAFRQLHGVDPRRFRRGCKGADTRREA